MISSIVMEQPNTMDIEEIPIDKNFNSSSSIFSFQSTSNSSTNGTNTELKPKRKSRVIKWDEVTIAEHDKERGTRQKIDEPMTPYRYQSESDQSEAESEISADSDAMQNSPTHPGHVNYMTNMLGTPTFIPSQISKENRKNRNSPSLKKKKTISFNPENIVTEGITPDSTTKVVDKTNPQVSTMNDWSQLHAKLNYHQYLQENSSASIITDSSSSSSSSSSSAIMMMTTTVLNEVPMIEEEEGEEENGIVEETLVASMPNISGLRLDPAVSTDPEERGGSDFALRRAAHYNEYKVIQALRSRGLDEEDEDEDDNEDNNVNNHDNRQFEDEKRGDDAMNY